MSGSKVDNMPTSFREASARLEGKPERTIANNTRLRRGLDGFGYDDPHRISLVLHTTAIVTWDVNHRVMLTHGGYTTVTTKARMNAALRGTRYRIHAVNYAWKLYDTVTRVEIDFPDGEWLNLDPDQTIR